MDLDTFDVDLRNALGICDVFERISMEDQEVRFFSRGEHAHLIQLHILSRAARGRDDDLHRSHASSSHALQFMLFGHTERMICETRIGAQNDLRIRSGKLCEACLLYTSDAADERSSVD